MPSNKHTALFKTLVKLLSEQTIELGHRLSNEQLSNLRYAFQRISPKDPVELAYVIAIGIQQKLMHKITDRYHRERERDVKIFFPYNKVKGIQKALAKTWGVLLYREQVRLLLIELTGRSGELPGTVLLDIDVLTECLKKEYLERLTEREIEKIHKDLRLYTKNGMNSYKWCLEMAERVLRANREDKN